MKSVKSAKPFKFTIGQQVIILRGNYATSKGTVEEMLDGNGFDYLIMVQGKLLHYNEKELQAI